MSEHERLTENEPRWSATLLAIWQRRRWLALSCLSVPLTVAIATAVFLPDRYRSVAVVEVHPAASAIEAAPGAVEQQLQRLNEENLSRSRLQTLIERYGLYPQLRQQASMEAAIDQMRRDVFLEVKDAEHPGGRSTVAFQVAFRGRHPEQVAQVANTLASFYVDKGRERRAESTSAAVARLRAQVDEANERLAVEEKRVADFMSLHLLELPEQVRANLVVLERLNVQLAQSRLAKKRARTSRAATQDAAAVQVLGPEAPEPELTRLEDELASLRGKVTEKHPDVVRLRKEIAALTAAPTRRRLQTPPLVIASARPDDAAPDEPAQAPLPQVDDDRRALAQSIAATEQRVFNAPKREQELQALLAPYESARQLHAGLVARLEDARFTDAFERQHAVEPFVLLDRAVASKAPVAPDRIKVALGGLLLALLLATFAVWAAEKLDTSFHSLDELRAFTVVPVLVSVPGIVVVKDTLRVHRRARWLVALMVAAVGASAGGTWVWVHENESLVAALTRGHA